jgi:hypothetical protein
MINAKFFLYFSHAAVSRERTAAIRTAYAYLVAVLKRRQRGKIKISK